MIRSYIFHNWSEKHSTIKSVFILTAVAAPYYFLSDIPDYYIDDMNYATSLDIWPLVVFAVPIAVTASTVKTAFMTTCAATVFCVGTPCGMGFVLPTILLSPAVGSSVCLTTVPVFGALAYTYNTAVAPFLAITGSRPVSLMPIKFPPSERPPIAQVVVTPPVAQVQMVDTEKKMALQISNIKKEINDYLDGDVSNGRYIVKGEFLNSPEFKELIEYSAIMKKEPTDKFFNYITDKELHSSIKRDARELYENRRWVREADKSRPVDDRFNLLTSPIKFFLDVLFK